LLPLVGIDASPARPKNIYRFLGALQDGEFKDEVQF
jgi:hypothetical protein